MDKKIAACVEALCEKGCRSVRADIAALEKGKVLPETKGLDRATRLKVLKELKAIMAVYGDTCRLP